MKLKLQYQVVIQDNILISNQYSIGMHLCYLELGYISVLWPVTILSMLDFWFFGGFSSGLVDCGIFGFIFGVANLSEGVLHRFFCLVWSGLSG